MGMKPRLSVPTWVVQRSLACERYSCLRSSSIRGKARDIPILKSIMTTDLEHIWSRIRMNGGTEQDIREMYKLDRISDLSIEELADAFLSELQCGSMARARRYLTIVRYVVECRRSRGY